MSQCNNFYQIVRPNKISIYFDDSSAVKFLSLKRPIAPIFLISIRLMISF